MENKQEEKSQDKRILLHAPTIVYFLQTNCIDEKEKECLKSCVSVLLYSTKKEGA